MGPRLFGGLPSREEPPFTRIDPDSEEVQSATAEAQKTIDEFIAAFQKPKRAQRSFSISAPLREQDQTEYPWLSVSAYEDGQFTGVIANVLRIIKAMKIGEVVGVNRHDVFDWLYVDNGKLVGGRTLRLLRGKLTAEKRQELDRSLSFVVGDDIDPRDPLTRLLDAIGNHEDEVCARLLREEPDLVGRAGTVCIQDILGDMVRAKQYPIEYAVYEENVEAARLLLRGGADPDVKDEFGYRPIHTAAMKGLLPMLAVLAEHGADIEARSARGETPLKVAAGNNEVGSARVLVELGANARVVEWEKGECALHNMMCVETARVLVEAGAEMDVRDKQGRTPLHVAVLNGNASLAAFLVGKGANPDIRNREGETAVQLAHSYLEDEDLAMFLSAVRESR